MFFLYYLPRVESSQVSPAILRSRGLGELFRDSLGSDFNDRVTMRDCAIGPDGSSGSVVVALPTCEHQQRIGYYPDQQTWTKVENGDESIYIGTDNEQPPTPAGLERSVVVDGYEYELGDKQIWIAPVIRQPDGTPDGKPLLPCSWGVNASGQFEQKLLPDYLRYWDMAGEIWDAFTGVRNVETPEAFAYCVRLLSINYRLGPHEVSRLALLNSENYVKVFKAAVDGERLETFLSSPEGQASLRDLEQSAFDPQKKTESTTETPNSNAGPPAETPAIDPVAANSG